MTAITMPILASQKRKEVVAEVVETRKAIWGANEVGNGTTIKINVILEEMMAKEQVRTEANLPASS